MAQTYTSILNPFTGKLQKVTVDTAGSSVGPNGAIQFGDGAGNFQGTSNAVVDASGNVSFAGKVITGSLSDDGSGQKLQVNGGISINGVDSLGTNFQINFTGGNGIINLNTIDGGSNQLQFSSFGGSLWSQGINPGYFGDNRYFICYDQQTGNNVIVAQPGTDYIGINNQVNPQYPLDVNGAIGNSATGILEVATQLQVDDFLKLYSGGDALIQFGPLSFDGNPRTIIGNSSSGYFVENRGLSTLDMYYGEVGDTGGWYWRGVGEYHFGMNPGDTTYKGIKMTAEDGSHNRKIGINFLGNATPAYTLDVNGDVHGTGFRSSDGSAGISTTITSASLVGKTITIKNGLITSFA